MTITENEINNILTGNWTPGQIASFERAHPLSDSGTEPRKGDTYFYLDRPVTVIRVEDGRCLVRAGNASKNLDVWVEWEELRGLGLWQD